MNYNYDLPVRKPEKKKSNTGLLILLFSLFIIIIILIGAYFYIDITDKYDKKLSEYEVVIDNLKKEYDSQFDGNQGVLDDLSKKLSALSSEYSSINSQTEFLSNASSNFNIAETAKSVSPSVIGIRVTLPVVNAGGWYQTDAYRSEGSGIIISEDGYIATNYHVIEYAKLYSNTILEVILNDGTEYSARLVGGDELNDLAVIKVDGQKFHAADLGISENVNVGDFVIAIGNPLGADLYGSVTFGIISGTNRKVNAENVAEELIQTDAAINPGNSGGALINTKGEIIGINTIKISSSEAEGLGFAIPIDYAKPILESLIKYGYVKDRPTTGITGSDISRMTAQFYGVPQGVIVSAIDKTTNAAASGIQLNDIVTSVDGIKITTFTEMNDIVKKHKVGDIIKIEFWRSKQTFSVALTISEKR